MRKMLSKRSWLALTVALILAAGFAVVRNKKRREFLEIPVRRGPVVQAVYGIGTVTANKIYSLRVGVTATVIDLYVRQGDFVPRGARLLSIDGPTVFRSPFAGTVTSLWVKIGETVFPQASLLVLTDLRDLYVVVSLEQQAAILVKPGQKASISFENMRDRSYEGQVRTVYSNTGQFLVDIQTARLPPAILPDMTADVGIQIDVHENALIVPVAALSQNTLLKKTRGKIRKTSVEVRLIDGENAEVAGDDLREGDIVVIPRK